MYFYFYKIINILSQYYYLNSLYINVIIISTNRLSGPNTGLAWISEGRRKVPLMPRGIAQTMYTEIADKAAEAAAAENKEIQKRLEAEKLIAPKSNEEEMPNAEGQTAESALTCNDSMDETMYPPIAMEDQTNKVSFFFVFHNILF